MKERNNCMPQSVAAALLTLIFCCMLLMVMFFGAAIISLWEGLSGVARRLSLSWTPQFISILLTAGLFILLLGASLIFFHSCHTNSRGSPGSGITSSHITAQHKQGE